LVYVTRAKEYLSEEGYRNSRSVDKGSLLVACIAGSVKSIGRAALTDRKVAFNQQINAIEPNDTINPKFLYYLFKSCPEYIQDHASHGMKRLLSKGDFQKINLIAPKIETQNHFANHVQAIEAQKAMAQKELVKADELFNGLLQKAFKGELV
jgi:type I restriction enzyme S subunit